MRGAFGKPQGLVARVKINQVLISLRTKDQFKAHAIEAMRRAKFKFPGRQDVNLYVKYILFRLLFQVIGVLLILKEKILKPLWLKVELNRMVFMLNMLKKKDHFQTGNREYLVLKRHNLLTI